MFNMSFKEVVMTSPMINIVLLLCSITMLAYALERWWTYGREGKFDEKFWDRISNFVLQNRLKDAISLCEVTRGVYAKVFRAGIEASQFTRQDVEDSMIIMKEECQEQMRRRLGLFGTLSFISPLLGLLGTVLGIMNAFQSMALAGSGGPTIIANGIAQALITTVFGILVAVPSAILYNYFTFRLRGIIVLMNSYSQRLLVLIYEKKSKGTIAQ